MKQKKKKKGKETATAWGNTVLPFASLECMKPTARGNWGSKEKDLITTIKTLVRIYQ